MLRPFSFPHVFSACRRALLLPTFRPFTLSSSSLGSKPLPARLKIENADLTVSYLKGSGPGGQKINKTNSAVQMIHKPTGIVVKSQATRSRSQNEKIARQLLADKVEQLQNGDQCRVALKAELARKKKASKVKKTRRKYRELADNQESPQEDEEGSYDGGDGEKLDQQVEKTASSSETTPESARSST